MTADSLREKFLNFFKTKKHKIIESDSLIPRDDPTVLFTCAGMNQFKKQFLGASCGFSRAATVQRCLRTDDLDKVGKTTGHHTFFEMLGNFSFGDYFKKEAIALAWEFLTEVLEIDKEKLWVSVYRDDDEAFSIWKDSIKIPEARIIKLGDKDNFWPQEAKEKGPNGPCGECSEIFFDTSTTLSVNPESSRGVDNSQEVGCGRKDCDPACDCGRFVELWNLVFTQYNRKAGGVLEPLAKKNIDTGMGLERLTAVVEGVKNNFETELFSPLIKEIASRVEVGPPKSKELLYAISDHIRAIVFAISDGVLPANEARGYVVRKLIRKSTSNLISLGITKPFLYKLVPVLAKIMHAPYPELGARQENIAGIILAEEKNFTAILESSDDLLKNKFKEILKSPDPVLAGKITFQLYDTYGIPLEGVLDWLAKQKIKISQEAFNQELTEQKKRSKLQSAMKGDVFGLKNLVLGVKQSKFLGYQAYQCKAKILKIIKDAGESKKITQGDSAKIILDRTPFYPESGGQVADTGELSKGKNRFEVIDTEKADQVIVHIGRVKQGTFKRGDFISAEVDQERRLAIARNHTATHLLQAALRKVLGLHLQQQGSLVAPERLRFDFRHFKEISKEELDRVEEIVNNYLIDNQPLAIKEVSLQAAKKSGALAFFGEKYGAKVRVVSIGDFSQEFCAGTHLDSTGQIGIFKILQEGSIAAGIRRIEAVTGKLAQKRVKEEENILQDVCRMLNIPQERIREELQKRILRLKDLEKQLDSQRLDSAKSSLDTLIASAEKINNLKLITKVFENLEMHSLRKIVDLVKEKSDNSIIALGSSSQGRALLVVGLTSDLCARGLDAAQLIREAAKIIGGSGGGRKDFSQAGGRRPENFQRAFGELKNIVNKLG